MAYPSCSPPKSQGVKAHTRSKPRTAKKKQAAAAKRRSQLAWTVVNSRTGAVVSRHRTMTAATRERRRLDLISYRRGQGRPYEARKAA